MFCCVNYQLNYSHFDKIIHACACIFQGLDLESSLNSIILKKMIQKHFRKHLLPLIVWVKERERKERERILQWYASVDKYDESHGGFTFLHFKLWCAWITAPISLYSVQYPVTEI